VYNPVDATELNGDFSSVQFNSFMSLYAFKVCVWRSRSQLNEFGV